MKYFRDNENGNIIRKDNKGGFSYWNPAQSKWDLCFYLEYTITIAVGDYDLKLDEHKYTEIPEKEAFIEVL